ncbi:MAG: glucose-1-phosphate cytidylyltransferase [Candidatus Altiarchaeota archaeon]
MKVVILCGGQGTRLKEETEFRPKPMVEVGGRPLLWHIMKGYSHYGFREFVLCLGYKGQMIKEYFLHYAAMNNDVTLRLGDHDKLQIHGTAKEEDWVVTLADTGEEALTGTRVKRIERYIQDDVFMLTYGDGLADVDIKALLDFHKAHGKIGTVTGVPPSSRFGELVVKGERVANFQEKPKFMSGLISGGFFVFNREFFKYLDAKKDRPLESAPLARLAQDGELMVYKHTGFWQCVDTYRELKMLNDLWKSGNPPWREWK